MKFLSRLDWPLLAAQFGLLAVGLLLMASLDQAPGSPHLWGGPLFRKQLEALVPGLFLFAGAAFLDYRRWRSLHPLFYAGGVVAALAVLRGGLSVKGAQRWLELGSLGSMQPSEPIKLCVVLTLAAVLARALSAPSWAKLGVYLMIPALPAVLILKQPDLGSAAVLIGVGLAILYAAGASPVRLSLLLLPALAGVAGHLHGYQKDRLLVFLDPDRDPTGTGWNLVQARLAIGGGHLLGQGLFAGAQKQLHYVPEQNTDFIFTVAGEELGWLGCMLVLALYGVILLRGLSIAGRTRDPFGALLSLGVVSLLAIHVLVNVGMVIGLLPVVGVPLPLLSAGGSNLWTTLIGLGLLQSVLAHRPVVLVERGLVAEPGWLRDPDRRTPLTVLSGQSL